MKDKKLFNDGFVNFGDIFSKTIDVQKLIFESKKLLDNAILNKENLEKIEISQNDFNDDSIGEGSYALKRIDQHNKEISKILQKIFNNSQLNEVLEKYLGKNFKVHQISVRKSSENDKGLGIHQDGPGQMNLVILLDDNNDIYGSTVFLKNSHLINSRAEELKLLTPPFFLKLYRFCLSYISGKSGDICLFINRTWHGRYPSSGKKSKYLIFISLHAEGTEYGSEHDDWYNDNYLGNLPNSKFKDRINHKVGTTKISDKIFLINDSSSKKISLSFEQPKKNKIGNISLLNLFYLITTISIVYPARFIKRCLGK